MMRSITTLCIYFLLAATSLAQSIAVKPFEGIVAKSVKVEQLTDTVVVILEERQPGTKTGAYLQVTSDKKWATPLLDGVTISETKTAGEWILFSPPGKYRLLLAEFDPESGPRYSFHDLVIPGTTKPDPKPEPDPVDPPPTGDFAELQAVAKRIAGELNDPKTRNALSAAYKSTLSAMPNRSYEQNVAAVKSARNFVLSSRLGSSRMVDWNQWLLAVDVELQRVVKAGDNAGYAKAIDAIASALQ